MSDQWTINYAAVVNIVPRSDTVLIATHLAERLPSVWLEVYSTMTPHPVNALRVVENDFLYVYDFYSQFEGTGEIDYDPKIEDRLIGVLGHSKPVSASRDVSRQRGWVGPTQKTFGKDNDKGHFVAHSLGGGLEINVFVQKRSVNRGWCDDGKLYRRMECFCADNPGTFFFSRPFYADLKSKPSALEFGLLKPNGELWTERFPN